MAKLPPPPGFGVWAISMSTVNSPHTSVITCGFRNTLAQSALTCNGYLRTSMAHGSSPFLPASFSAQYSVINTYVLINTGGLLTVHNDPTLIAGTSVINTPSLNTAMIIRKNTVYAGRQYRGRMFAPPIGLPEGDVTAAGNIVNPSYTTNNNRWSAFHGQLVANSIQPALIHQAPLTGPTPAPTDTSGFSLTPLIGTIKRRIRR